MAAPVWQPGTIYIPGDLVQPVSGTPAAGQPIVNPLITGSATGWTLPAQFSYDGAVSFTAGSGSIRFNTVGNGFFQFAATAGIAVSPGQSITASCMFQQGASDSGNLAGTVNLFWYNSGDVLISSDAGNIINSGSGGAWAQSTVTAVAPAGAAFVRIGGSANRVGQNLAAWFDNFTWNYTGAGTPAGLIYKAVQPASGVSGSQEPVWPSVLGVQVVDNTVTWEAIAATRVTWKATPALVSGGSEPVWPTQVGESVSDGTIKWTAYSRRVEDVNCPNSKVVAIVQSKVFAADGDIVRFCATANPLDWTSERDAGYLPTGLQQANANDMSVLNQYRSNLVAFNPSVFQNWQADPDPEVMALLDQMEGVGSTWQHAARPVGNELFYLSQLGVRTVGIAGGSTNLQAGDVGMPVDPLVQNAIFVATSNDTRVVSTYYPSAGQYWLAFSDYEPAPLDLTGDLPSAAINTSGTYQYQAGGGVLPYSFSIVSGALPPGATMDANGLVTYTYTTVGDYSWTVQVTDAFGNFATLPDTATVSYPAGYQWEFLQGMPVQQYRAGITSDTSIVLISQSSNNLVVTHDLGDTFLTKPIPWTGQSGCYCPGLGPNAGRFIVSRGFPNIVYSDDDGDTWIEQSTTNSSAYRVTLFNGVRIIRLGQAASCEYSLSGLTGSWVNSPIGGSADVSHGLTIPSPDGVGGPVVAFHENGTITRSTTGGSSWTGTTIAADPAPSLQWRGVTTDGVTMRAYKYNGTSTAYVYTSTDLGSNWTVSTFTPTADGYQGGPIQYMNGLWVGGHIGTTTPGNPPKVWSSTTGLPPFAEIAVVNANLAPAGAVNNGFAFVGNVAITFGNASGTGWAYRSPL